MDGSEVVIVALVISGGNSAEVFELVEEPLNGVALSVNPGAERQASDAVRHRPDISPGAARGEPVAQVVAVIGPVPKGK